MTPAANAPATISDAVKCDLAAEALRSFGALRFAATGWSMLPTIFPGDILLVERIDQNDVKLGDVILVGCDGRLRAHRVVRKSANSDHAFCLTQGDAMPLPDPPVSSLELLGRVSCALREGKRIPLPPKLSPIDRLLSIVIRRSFFAARVLVYLHKFNRIQNFVEGPAKESITPCQG